MKKQYLFLLAIIILAACKPSIKYDVIIRNGTVYDGSGGDPVVTDIGIVGDSIVALENLDNTSAATEIDAIGMAVAPGFINMLSWATTSLIEDGRSLGDIKQGVTLEVFGEGWSEGPLNDVMKEEITKDQGDIKYDIKWTTLGEYMDYLVEKGVSCNIASYVGATTLRIHELAFENRSPTPEELERMKNLVRTAMEEGALGIGSSLIYAPAFYADTEELIELCKVASEYGGSYISHMRSEGDYFLEAIDELMRISKEANLPAEIYHLKAGGKENWHKMDLALAKIDSARNAGLAITADMYNYIAGATGLDASMPPWVQEGGYDEWSKRLKDLEIRKKIKGEIENKGAGWENLYYAAGTPDNLLLVGFKEDSLKYLTGKTLTEVAQLRNQDPVETMMDLVIQDGSRVGTVYFLMNEENLVKQIKKDYVSFCSDAESEAPEGVFLKSNPHPRAYGNFARLLGKYVREENVISLQEAIRRLTSLPASNIKIKRRGSLAPGFKADVVIFDPNEIRDHATFEKPHQYATGVRDVFVNGIQVLSGGEHTGNFPGRVVRGPGWKGQ
jgi:N-acyl-D-amino-acid deacylase